MAYRRKTKPEDETQQEASLEERLPTVEEVEENIKRVIEIDKKIEEALEKLENFAPTVETKPQIKQTGKIFLGEEDKRLIKKFNQHIVNKLGISGNRSFKI